MKILITEEEKENILLQYSDDHRKVITYLRRHYPIHKVETDLGFKKEMIGIYIDDKIHWVDYNKKRIVNKIYNEIADVFKDIDTKTIRQSIKKYVDESKKVD